ncbi:hypothetical protein H310_14132 [Aphanomyces invadans]|uniref:Uncharacterized protein n=1 Tax=Aphanomyces invadans TaxID=157072 RepID=A0A024TD94_9STRA|nr:hypothetical protein H310_14132 [Aphanomyces invadans]ETV91312.1 hypothetical protein H310_14132 [Aphanomyces invadans]|eukprot:XP_008880149.1 hypothetical protein H310_14132 [Aphanomyces invadans]
MQRVELIKETLLSSMKAEKDPSDLRDAELTDEMDGAWAEGKAPIALITQFLGFLEDEETELAMELAQKILGYEPSNQLVHNLFKALQLKLVVDQQESDGESGDESSDSSGDDSTDDQEDGDESDEEHIKAAATDDAVSEAKDVEL